MTQIGDNLKSLRTNKGWSQERLAEAAGVSQTTIDKIEKGLTIRSRYLGDIADALEVPLSAIDPSFKRHDEYDSNIGLESRTAQSSEITRRYDLKATNSRSKPRCIWRLHTGIFHGSRA